MSGSGGGGSSVLAAYMIIRNKLRGGSPANASPERVALDAEELREVEYEEMGLPLPEHQPPPSTRRSFLRRLLRR